MSGRVPTADRVRLGLGVVAVARPQWLLRGLRAADGTRVRRVVRVLGARHVAQAGAGVLLRRHWSPRLDVAVELVHAASTVVLVVVFPSHRRAAVASGAVALALAVMDLRRVS